MRCKYCSKDLSDKAPVKYKQSVLETEQMFCNTDCQRDYLDYLDDRTNWEYYPDSTEY